MKLGKVSIITPVYNAACFIGLTIDSVLGQTYTDFEMIIIDDGSSDESTSIILQFLELDCRIKFFSQQNAGSAAARNNGIRRAEGQFICLLDADDTWEPEFLKEQLNFMRLKNAHLVFCSHKRINENSVEILKPFIVPSKVDYHSLLKTCSISCLTGVYDTLPFGKVYLKEEFRSLRDDYIYWLEIIKKIKTAYGNPSILANYRILNHSVSRKKTNVIYPQYRVLREVEKINFIASVYYLLNWAIFGYLKYKR